MKKCPQCQIDNPASANFCNNCGASITEKSIRVQSSKTRKAERRQLTILFCDLVGSTPLSELLDPEEYRQVITDYHKLAEIVIRRNGGHIAQYLGDGLLVYFGYPEGLEDAPKVAIQSGLEILKDLEKANKRWESDGKTTIKIRIGIHTGLVVVDDHLALGETVNVAARLEGMAPHNGLLISSQTLNLVHGWFEVKSLGKQSLKGISTPMEIFHVLHTTGAKTRLEVAKGKGLSPLVGREEELQQMLTSWNQAQNKIGSLLLLRGEAGIGKSRIVDTLQEIVARNPGNLQLEARCSANHKNSSFYPIIELLEDTIFQFVPSDSNEIRIVKLENYLNQSHLDFDSAMSLLAEFLSISSDNYPPLVMSPFAKRQKIMDLLSQLILDQTYSYPILFILEDLHWADGSTLEWLKSFTKKVYDRPILSLCTTRPGIQTDWINTAEVKQIQLERLSKQNIREICLHQSHGKSLPREVLEQISTKTEGVPLFVEELTKMIVESDQLIEKEDHFAIDNPLSDLRIPSTLQDSLLARLDRLSNVKDIVQVGSVVGREFSIELLKALLPGQVENMESSLVQLLEAEIFAKGFSGEESMYQFKHALLQDAAYESLLKSHRQQIHQSVAEVLSSQFEKQILAQPEVLAYHLTEAGLIKEAIPIWLQAGQKASQKNASLEAIAHLEKGLSLLPLLKNKLEKNKLELDFLLTLGGTYVVSHGFPHPKVKETFNKARDVAQTMEVNPKLALVLFGLLSYYFNTEDFKAHGELANYMFKLSEDKEHGYWFELFAEQLVGGARIIKGDLQQANQSYQRVLELFDPSIPFPWELSPSGYLEIGAKAWQMICLQILGHMDKAKELADQHLLFAENHSDSMTLYHIHTFPALYKLEAREWESSEKILEAYLPIVKEFGDPVFSLTADVYYNIAQAFQGNRNAFKKAVELINICFDIGFKAFAVTLSPFIGEKYYELEEYDSALSWIEKILAHVNKTGTHIHTAELLRLKGLTLHAMDKDSKSVEKLFRDAIALSRKQSARTYELRSSCNLARILKSQGKVDEAVILLQGIYDWFTEGKDSVDLKEASHLLKELKV